MRNLLQHSPIDRDAKTIEALPRFILSLLIERFKKKTTSIEDKYNEKLY